MSTWTFNQFPANDYRGPCLVLAAGRLGDHAHIKVMDGHQRVNGDGRPQINYGEAGYLVMAWEAWLYWRDQLAALPNTRIAEIEKPTSKQLDSVMPRPALLSPQDTETTP